LSSVIFGEYAACQTTKADCLSDLASACVKTIVAACDETRGAVFCSGAALCLHALHMCPERLDADSKPARLCKKLLIEQISLLWLPLATIVDGGDSAL